MTSQGTAQASPSHQGVAAWEDLIMLRLIWNTSIRIRMFLRTWMPTNILLDALRTRRGLKWGAPAMLLSVVYFAIAYWCTTLIDNGAPGWLHLIVLRASTTPSSSSSTAPSASPASSPPVDTNASSGGGTSVHLEYMKHYRVTSTGRRISAEPRLRPKPDNKRLIALVLYIADELHAHELDEQQRRIGDQHTSENSTPACTSADEQGDDHDSDDAYDGDRHRAAVDGGDLSAGLDQRAGVQGRA